MPKMFIKTIPVTLDNNPLTWSDNTYNDVVENNVIVGYLLSTKTMHNMSLNLYLLPINSLNVYDSPIVILYHSDLRSIFLQWLEGQIIAPNLFQFRNPPLEYWLETRLNWIKALCNKIHQKYGTDPNEALSTAYMTILRLYNKGNVYIGNLHYLEIAIYTAIKKEHHFMRNRLTGNHPNAIHLDASPGDFNLSIENDVTDFHEIIAAPTWETEEEQRYSEIWEKMKKDLLLEFSEREVEQICKGSVYISMPLYRRLLTWRKEHPYDDYL